MVDDDIRSIYSIKYSKELGVLDGDNYDLALIEGSVSTREQEEVLREIEHRSVFIVALGTCAIQGGIQALRSGDDISIVKSTTYPKPDLVDVMSETKPVSEVIRVDYYIPGCPVDEEVLVDFLRKFSVRGLPIDLDEPVCSECKRMGINCITVSKGTPCIGPLTKSGCRALCPSIGRGCYGCSGLRTGDLDPEKLKSYIQRLVELGYPSEHGYILLKTYGSRSLREIYGKASR